MIPLSNGETTWCWKCGIHQARGGTTDQPPLCPVCAGVARDEARAERDGMGWVG